MAVSATFTYIEEASEPRRIVRDGLRRAFPWLKLPPPESPRGVTIYIPRAEIRMRDGRFDFTALPVA